MVRLGRATAAVAVAGALLTLALAGCRMPHVPQEVASESDEPAGGEPVDAPENPEGEPADTPEDPGGEPEDTPVNPLGDRRGVTVQPSELNVREGAGGSYTVVLARQPTEQVTVVARADPATAPVSVNPSQLKFTASNWAGARTVTVTADADATVGDRATIRHAVSGGDYAGEPAPAVAVTITEPPPLELASLQVSGGGTMYPAFAPGVRHYAVTCADLSTLQVTARASRTAARLTLLRADEDDNQAATGSLDAQVAVSSDHDVVIELGDGTATYVVHCIPEDFPDIRMLTKTEQVLDGLLFVTPYYHPGVSYLAILDNNGVPRFQRRTDKIMRNFRRHSNGPLVNGTRVRYSASASSWVALYDGNFELIRTVETAGLQDTDDHDFLITGDGTYLFIAYEPAQRDFSDYGASATQQTHDSVIQEVTVQGSESFRWNSWDHRDVMQLGDDCTVHWNYLNDYAHLNSLHVIDGDIVASFRHCSQVLRIDGETGAVAWKLGGRVPPEDSGTGYLEISGDPSGEFCGQHAVTLSAAGSLVLFDNGILCLGSRRGFPPFTRVVEYDISSGTQAVYQREYRQPAGQGSSPVRGGVAVLEQDDWQIDHDRWLIAWGATQDRSVSPDQAIAVSEVDPSTGTAHLHMHMSKSDRLAHSYRVYREREAEVPIPLNLP